LLNDESIVPSIAMDATVFFVFFLDLFSADDLVINIPFFSIKESVCIKSIPRFKIFFAALISAFVTWSQFVQTNFSLVRDSESMCPHSWQV